MIDVPESAVAAVRDPLVVTLVLFSLAGLLTHLLFRRHPPHRAMVAAWFSDRLHRLFDLANAE
jgi:hypothetical protein